MKYNKMKYHCFIYLNFVSMLAFGQNWLPLDKGIGHPYATILHLLPDTTDNLIYVSGNFTEDGNGISMRGIAKWDGTKWDSVGDANKFNATKLGLYKYHDTLLTSGIFYDWPYSSLAKLEGNLWEPIPNSRDLGVNFYLEKDDILYMGGGFNKCGNDSTFGLGKYDGTTFSGMTPCYKPNGAIIQCMAFFQDTLYVGGSFYLYPQLPIAGLAKWDGFNLVQVATEFTDYTCIIESMVVYKNELYIGGGFRKIDGFTGDFIMKWDGHQLSEVGSGANERITCMKVYNNNLYVGGWFTEIGGIECKNVAKWDGNQWTSLNNDVFDEFYSIRDLCIFKDELYVAGTFRKIGNDSINSVAKYNHSLLSLNDISDADNHLSIYPNPFTISTTLSLSNPLVNATLNIRDILGKEVKQMKNLNGYEVIINSCGLNKGLYFCSLSDVKGFIGNGKFIIE